MSVVADLSDLLSRGGESAPVLAASARVLRLWRGPTGNETVGVYLRDLPPDRVRALERYCNSRQESSLTRLLLRVHERITQGACIDVMDAGVLVGAGYLAIRTPTGGLCEVSLDNQSRDILLAFVGGSD